MKAKNLQAGKHADGQGLWLVKRTKRAGNWILRLSMNGKRREMGMGRWPDVSIAEARERAANARRKLRDGIDPIAERAKARLSIHGLSLAEAIDGCFNARKAQLKGDGEAGRWLSPLNVHIIPKLGTRPVEDIDQHSLKNVLEPIWHEKPGSAAKALNRVNLTLKHAAALGLDVDLQAAMKTRALLGKQRHKVTHIPSLPYADAPEFYRWLKTVSGIPALALRFLILTVARTSEIRFATFDEFQDDIWHLPAERTKTSQEHRIPLTTEALQIVKIAREMSQNEYLFASYRGKPMSDVAMSKFMRENGYDARPHGFRSSFRVWAEEQTDAAFEVKEACLAHHVDTGVVEAYQRSDRLEKRRELLKQWSTLLISS